MHASCTVTSVRAEVTLMTVPRSTSSAADNVHVSPWSRSGRSERERENKDERSASEEGSHGEQLRESQRVEMKLEKRKKHVGNSILSPPHKRTTRQQEEEQEQHQNKRVFSVGIHP